MKILLGKAMVLRAWFIWLPLFVVSPGAFSSAPVCGDTVLRFASEFDWTPYSFNEFRRTNLHRVLTQNASPSLVAKLVKEGKQGEFRRLVLVGRGSIEPALAQWGHSVSAPYLEAERARQALRQVYDEWSTAFRAGAVGELLKVQPVWTSVCAASAVGCAASAVSTFFGLLPGVPGASLTVFLGAAYGVSGWMLFRRNLDRVYAGLPPPEDGFSLLNPFRQLQTSLDGSDGIDGLDLGFVIQLSRENLILLLTRSPEPRLELVSIRW